MNITRLAVTRVQVTLTFLLFVLLGGVIAYDGLPKAEDPGFTIRQVSIVTGFPGASPRRVEQLISARLEEALQQIPQLKTIRSTSRSGVSLVSVEISDTITDLAPIHTDIREAVEDVQADLPADAMPSEVNTDAATVYGVVYAVVSDGFSHLETVNAAKRVKDAMLLVPEASKVRLYGEQQRRIALEFEHGRLARMGLTPDGLAAALRSTNIVTPGGTISVGGEILSIEPSGSFTTIDDIRAMLVTLPSGALVSLSDLVEVKDALEVPAAPRAFYNGQEAVFVGVAQRPGGNSERFGEQIRETAERLRADLPLGLELEVVNFQPDDVQVKIDDFLSSLIQSIVIVFIVMMAFLGVRTGLIVASLIPTVVCATFFGMNLLGIGIDQMSLAALLIALGMLVDNSIVIAENTQVRMQRGETAIEAAVGAANELRIPLLVSSLTTCAAFLPVYLAPGGASEFVGPIFKVVTIALMSSWFLAITTLSLICVLFLQVPVRTETTYNAPVYQFYRRAIRSVLRHRALSVAASLALLFAAVWGFGFVKTGFFPPSEKPSFTLSVELAPGTDEAVSGATLERLHSFVETELDGPNGVVVYASMQGSAMPPFSLSYGGPPESPGTLAALLHTHRRADIDRLTREVEDWVKSEIPGATVSAQPLVMGPGGAAPIGVELSSTNEDALLKALSETTAWLRDQAGTRNLSDDWGPRTKKLRVRVDSGRSELAGVSHQDVASSLLTSLSGIEATQLRTGETSVPVQLLAGGEDLDLIGLENLTVFGQSASVALQQVADIEIAWDFGLVRRKNRRRAIQITAWPEPGISAHGIQASLMSWTTAQAWPDVHVEQAGELSDSAEANANLMSTIPLVVMVITGLLMLQFNDVRKVFINLAVLPFSLIGVTAGLLLFDSYFGFITMLAVISLFGLVLNNGNVLLDRIQLELDAGREPLSAIVEGSVTRVRPILLTTATTVTGLVPLYVGGGPMFEPLAVTLMAGLVFGTALTLGLVPVMYSVLFQVDATDPTESGV